MNTIPVQFCRNPIIKSGTIEQPTFNQIKNTFGLWNASYDDAIKYGGDITRQAIRCMNIQHDRKNIIVDTKIHMLMPGWSPSILGWHCDGAPRDKSNNPNGLEPPDTFALENLRANRYHIMVTGTGCLTQYINRPIYVDIPVSPSQEVYAIMSKYIQKYIQQYPEIVSTFDSCGIYQFDWWSIHTGVLATKKEWRYLIRVCESDYYEPRKDLREIIRLQSQIYSPMDFGW